MNYKEFLQSLFKIFNDLNNKNFDDSNDFESIREHIFDEISGPQIRDFYLNRIDQIIDERFPFFAKDLMELRKDDDISQYEFSISGFTCIIIFWIWENRIDINDEEIYKLIEAILLGTFGYRIIDIQHDLNKNNQHLLYLGKYLIQVHQTLILEIFKDPKINEVMNKYIEKYTIAEYLEKKNKWIGCPFSWEDPAILGYKAAPFFYILELLARKQGKDEKYINNVEKGFIAFAAAIQMMDDVGDAKTDLQNGIESLVMKGFLKEYGSAEITEKLVENYLDDERTMLIFKTTEKLFDVARDSFTENNDLIFLLNLESYNERFHKGITIIN